MGIKTYIGLGIAAIALALSAGKADAQEAPGRQLPKATSSVIQPMEWYCDSDDQIAFVLRNGRCDTADADCETFEGLHGPAKETVSCKDLQSRLSKEAAKRRAVADEKKERAAVQDGCVVPVADSGKDYAFASSVIPENAKRAELLNMPPTDDNDLAGLVGRVSALYEMQKGNYGKGPKKLTESYYTAFTASYDTLLAARTVLSGTEAEVARLGAITPPTTGSQFEYSAAVAAREAAKASQDKAKQGFDKAYTGVSEDLANLLMSSNAYIIFEKEGSLTFEGISGISTPENVKDLLSGVVSQALPQKYTVVIAPDLETAKVMYKAICIDAKAAVQAAAAPAPTCTDGIQNQGETGIDCGGSCPPCEPVIPPVITVELPPPLVITEELRNLHVIKAGYSGWLDKQLGFGELRHGMNLGYMAVLGNFVIGANGLYYFNGVNLADVNDAAAENPLYPGVTGRGLDSILRDTNAAGANLLLGYALDSRALMFLFSGGAVYEFGQERTSRTEDVLGADGAVMATNESASSRDVSQAFVSAGLSAPINVFGNFYVIPNLAVMSPAGDVFSNPLRNLQLVGGVSVGYGIESQPSQNQSQ